MIAGNRASEAFMKLRALIAALFLSLSVLGLLPAQIYANILTVSPASGPVGTLITIAMPFTYGLGSYKIYWDDSDRVLAEGEITQSTGSITFAVPEAARGKHKVSLRVAGTTNDAELTITPSLSANVTSGVIGTSVTVTGKGFNANEINIGITFDGALLETTFSSDQKGTFTRTVAIPQGAGGKHVIDAGGTTPSSEVPDVQFTITPKISIEPSAGGVGANIGIAGTGFGNVETNIVVTYDGLAVKSGIAADVKGSWNASFSAPTSARGNHTISAYGAITQPGQTPDVTFSVSPFIRVEMANGVLGDAIYVGDALWVSGIGFDGNEGSISILFDGNQVVGGIIADSKGSWIQKITVPASARGKHAIDALGQRTTTGDVPDASVSISPRAAIQPTTGNVGTDVTIIGDGFAGSKPITLNIDGAAISATINTDARGSFSMQFKAPRVKGGDHIVAVTDPSGSIATGLFTMESTPPGPPALISPQAGSRIGYIGSSAVTFTWSPVEDPSGIEYTMEIARAADFLGAMLRKEGLKQATYTLSEQESLGNGDYYWRVRAVDGAGNQGAWSTGQYFIVGGVQVWHIIAAILAVLILFGIIWRVVRISKKGGWK